MAINSAIEKRSVIGLSALVALVVAAFFLVQCGKDGKSAIFTQAPLPYSEDALAPVISAETMGLHYGKHYAGYVKKANDLTGGAAFAGKTPEAVIEMTADDPAKADIFNNAAQAWNHAFFFKCLKPEGGGAPEGRVADMIEAGFGSFDDFKTVFLTAAKDQFGSGWVWLVLEDGKLAVISSANADTPLAHGLTPLFTVDVWEHAYYLDYQNRRTDFVEGVLEGLVNWQFVAEQLDGAQAEAAPAVAPAEMNGHGDAEAPGEPDESAHS